MKLKKKTAMIVSFAVGTLLFATTALAEIATKNGYEQMKDALKNTSRSLTTEMKSYTTEMSAVLKDNGKVIYSKEASSRQDFSNGISDSTTTIVRGEDKATDYYYRDKTIAIRYNSMQDTYFVTENPNPKNAPFLRDPFAETQAEDIERIIDALVGNLKDYVVVSENADGSKELSGSLKETQIPALVNAVSSYAIKQQLGNAYYSRTAEIINMTKVTKDIYVKEVKGRLIVDKDGIIRNVFGTGLLFGKDESGKEHSLSFEVLGKVTDINSTKITKPDLTDKKVEKDMGPSEYGISNPEKYVGTYKNNIVIEKDGKFVKIGERILNITQLDDKTVSGSYKESYLSGYEEYAGDIKDFSFTGNIEKDGMAATVDLPEPSNLSGKANMHFVPRSPKIYFHPERMETRQVQYDGEFTRVFE